VSFFLCSEKYLVICKKYSTQTNASHRRGREASRGDASLNLIKEQQAAGIANDIRQIDLTDFKN